jgi:hypothetical protein
MLEQLRAWDEELEPLVREYEQILHVLGAFETMGAVAQDVRAGRRRLRGARSGQRRGSAVTAASQARLDELRGLLRTPRPRADLAGSMGLSPSRVTGLLDQLARAGEVVEIPDPERRSRKLWALATPPDGSGEPTAPRSLDDGSDVEDADGSGNGAERGSAQRR